VPLIGRKFRPETMFTFDALFETLPGYRADLFFDEGGRQLDVDLFDAASWRTYGWSVFGARTARRLEERERADLFADAATRLRRLEKILDRARRTHDLLRRDVEEFGDTRYYSIQNPYRPTGQRALLTRTSKGRWRTRFAGEAALKRDPRLEDLATADGDGYATVESQLWLSPQETAALAGPPLHVRARHREIIRHLETQLRILDILAER
jgi:hypothetical protein